mgnify:CR=1 FL=1
MQQAAYSRFDGDDAGNRQGTLPLRRATGRRRVFGGNGDGRHVRRPREHW